MEQLWRSVHFAEVRPDDEKRCFLSVKTSVVELEAELGTNVRTEF